MKTFTYALGSAALAMLLTACGGGGGSTSNPVVPVASPTPASNPAVSSVATQRSIASESLTVVSESNLSYQFAGSGTLSVGRSVRAAAQRVTAGWRSGARPANTVRQAAGVTYSACANSSESATIAVSSTEEQVYSRTFYDAACTELFIDSYIDVVATSSTAASASGTLTTYSTTGSVIDYATVTLSLTVLGSSGTVTLRETDASNVTSPPTASVGVSCGISGSALTCGGGATASVASLSEDVGDTLTLAGTNTTVVGGAKITMNGSVAAYLGGLGKLTLAAGTFPTWTIGGATSTDSGTYSGTFGYTTAGALTSAALSLGDPADDATVTIATSAATISGSITQTDSGKVYASFTTDTAGNGTITYGNGTTATIVNWQITG